jgi:hypothetical protein
MKPFLAIVMQTVRSALRSKVFHVLFVLILLAVFLLPVTVSGDGTAVSLVQIALTYSLGIVVALISATTLWLSCSQLSTEIEKYNIHMVVSKPCPRWVLWLGKWTGIFAMHAVILIVSAIIILVLIQLRVQFGGFTNAEIQRLDNEVRVGRKAYFPVPEPFEEMTEKEYQRQLASGEVKEGHDPALVKDGIRFTIKRQAGEVKPGNRKAWTFKNVKTDANMLFLQFRVFSGSTTSTNQPILPYYWRLKDPDAPPAIADPYAILMIEEKDKDGNPIGMKIPTGKGGTFQELPVPVKYIDSKDGNTISLEYINPPKDPNSAADPPTAILQANDGPIFLVSEVGFVNNYCRAIGQALLQLAFLTALGCTVSAAFSTPVAAFVAVTYLLIGLSVQAAIDAPLMNDDGTYKYKGFHDKAAHYLAKGVSYTVVSVDDFDSTGDLAAGRLVINKRARKVFVTMHEIFRSKPLAYTTGTFVLILRWALIIGLGIWILNRRELGAVIRK